MKQISDFLVQNWFLIAILVIGIVLFARSVKIFTGLPSDEQMKKVNEWLLWAVIATEKELGSGTGAIKLRYCYDLFIKQFPSLVTVVPFDLFSKMVDDALVQMKHLIETNLDIKNYVEGG